MRGQGRLGADLAAAALEAFEQRRLLAADIGAGADPHLHVERECRAEQREAEQAVLARRLDRPSHRPDRVRIFGADIDVAAGGADGEAGDRHALDQHEGIALHHHPVGEGAAVALVGVAHDIFLGGGRRRGGPPLDAGRETGAAAAAQAGGEHLLDRVGRADGDGALEALARPPCSRYSSIDCGSVMPQRAKVRRVWRLRKGSSSTRPTPLGCSNPATIASRTAGTSAAETRA